MLRVTPLWGSRWSPEGESERPSCTLVEYGGIRILWNVGWWCRATDADGDGSSSSSSFPVLPEHDCVVITDSTLQAAGGLPLYYRQRKRMLSEEVAKRKKRQREAAEKDKGGGGNRKAASNDDDDPTDDEVDVDASIKIYATFPVTKMGQMTLYDQHANLCFDGNKPPYELQDVDDVFAAIRPVKYSQPIPIVSTATATAADSSSSKDASSTKKPALSITAHRAGHVVGGAFFVLTSLKDDTRIVLTSRYHMARELHLDSSALQKYGQAPDAFVTHPGGPAFARLRGLAHGTLLTDAKKDARGSSACGRHPPAPLAPMLVTQAERNLTEAVLSVLRRDGNVLLPVDASGRVLELVLLLERHWDKQRLGQAYNLIWFAPMAHNTIEFVRAQLEWMAAALGQQFDSQAGHPFALRHVQMCSSAQEFEALIEAASSSAQSNPTCVLASGLSLENGPSRDLFLKWADNPDNAIIFTDSTQCYLRRTPGGTVVGAGSRGGMDTKVTATGQRGPAIGGDEIMPGSSVASIPVDAVAAAAAEQEEVEEGEGGLPGSAVAVRSEWTTAAQLLIAWSKAKYEQREMDDTVVVDVNVRHRAPLAGQELKKFLADEEQARLLHKQEQEKQALLREVEIAKGQLRLGEQQEGGTSVISASTAETQRSASSARSRPRKKSRFDSTLFMKFSKPLHRKFACVRFAPRRAFVLIHCIFFRYTNPFIYFMCSFCFYSDFRSPRGSGGSRPVGFDREVRDRGIRWAVRGSSGRRLRHRRDPQQVHRHRIRRRPVEVCGRLGPDRRRRVASRTGIWCRSRFILSQGFGEKGFYFYKCVGA